MFPHASLSISLFFSPSTSDFRVCTIELFSVSFLSPSLCDVCAGRTWTQIWETPLVSTDVEKSSQRLNSYTTLLQSKQTLSSLCYDFVRNVYIFFFASHKLVYVCTNVYI